MSTALVSTSKFARLRRPLLATALALAASASFAGTASVNITSFTVSTDGIDVIAPRFAWASNPFSDLLMEARNAGGLAGADTQQSTADSWAQGNNIFALTSAASASGNVLGFIDAMTQLQTGGFNLLASANRVNFEPALQPNDASASALQTGGFTLLDGDGNATGGTIIFDLYYSLAVSTTVGSPPNDYSEALLSFSASDNEGNGSFSDALNSATQTGGVGALEDGHFQLSFQLAAGEVVSYSLSGTAFAAAAPVPEPSTWAMALAGLLAVGGAAARKSRRRNA